MVSQQKVSVHGLIPVCRGVYIHYFKINPSIFCCPLFSENYFKPQVRINQMVNKHTVDYHPSPSQLISRIHSRIYFYGLLRGLSFRIFLEFFPNPVYSTMIAEKFQIYSVEITGKYISESKN